VRGKNNRPTVTSPREYKKRFREAMGRYYLEAPDCWHLFRVERVERRVLSGAGRAERVIERGQEGDEEKELQILL
jgi:1-phosphatidylinositol-3-phosphate 5-kinase